MLWCVIWRRVGWVGVAGVGVGVGVGVGGTRAGPELGHHQSGRLSGIMVAQGSGRIAM